VVAYVLLVNNRLVPYTVADKVISVLTTQSYTSHYCYKTKKGRKHYESVSPEIPTLSVKAFKKESLDLLSDEEISCNGNWCSQHDIIHEVFRVGGGMVSNN
jgi:hypothetical protein